MELIYQEKDLAAIVKQLLTLAAGKKIFLFNGEIGAGKTTLIKQLCSYLGSIDEISSPTYSIVNEYEYNGPLGNGLIYHLDLYRLNDIEEALHIGIEEYLDSGNYCLIEWPELIEALIDPSAVRIKIDIQPDSDRKISIL
jgi:tRNA threonylcarbamoyladenosine biosynthesis protein TsaE